MRRQIKLHVFLFENLSKIGILIVDFIFNFILNIHPTFTELSKNIPENLCSPKKGEKNQLPLMHTDFCNTHVPQRRTLSID